MNQRGFTLVELLVVATLMGVVGVALVRMLISDSRFVSQQEGMLDARQAARAAMTQITTELSMVGPNGLQAAGADSIVAVIPIAYGMSCGEQSGTVIATLMPTDSLAYATSTPTGLAWRDPATGVFTFATLTSVSTSTATGQCTQDSIRVVPGGELIGIGGVPSGTSCGAPCRPPSGRIFYLHKTIRYRFSPSTELPGRRALWRKEGAAAYEEIVTPFDTSARFAFLTGPSLTLTLTAPADLATVRGLELRLTTQSETTAAGTTQPEEFALVTRVPFVNVAN